MPNILKRPMFRRGGSASDGVGITSGLTNRRNYKDGPVDPDSVDSTFGDTTASDEYKLQNAPGALAGSLNLNPDVVAKAFQTIKKQLEPTTDEKMSDWLTSFAGSSGSTWGASAEDTAKTYQLLDAKRRELANKYAAEGAISAIKGMSKQQTEVMARRAMEMANNPNFMPGKSYQEKYDAALNQQFSVAYNPYKKDVSPTVQVKQAGEKYTKETGAPPLAGEQQAQFENWRRQNPTDPLVKNLDQQNYYLTPGMLKSAGKADTYKFNTDVKSGGVPAHIIRDFDKNNISKTYFFDGGIWMYKGNGEFQIKSQIIK